MSQIKGQEIALKNYSIYLGDLALLQRRLEHTNRIPYSRIFILVDENTRKHCLPLVRQWTDDRRAAVLEIPSGEKYKNIETCEEIWGMLLELGADRHSLLINLGGGVIGDMGGFAASTFMRGFKFINVPTTLLSMVDASVGGKLGVDFKEYKNMIGLFGDPAEVLVCPEFLNTLDERQLKSGFAEMLKHGLIRDADYWSTLSNSGMPDLLHLPDQIATSIRIKRAVVEEDKFESGLRKCLNFGHTVGHAIESWSLEHQRHPLLHGEAIAIGMVCETWLSTVCCDLPQTDCEKITKALLSVFPAGGVGMFDAKELINRMRHDKKNEDGHFRLSLLNAVGESKIDVEVSEDLLRDSLKYYERAAVKN